MSDYEEMGENQTQTVSSEVQSLFAESQAILSDNNKPYDYYVPLSVQIEDEMWDDLLPEAKDELDEEENIEEDADDKDSSEITMPIARVKRIMKMDPEVNIISKQATVLMAKATTLFIDLLASKLDEKVKQDGMKTVKNSHLIQVCSQTPCLQFLSEDLVIEESKPKRVKATTNQREKDKPSTQPTHGIQSFFKKKQL